MAPPSDEPNLGTIMYRLDAQDAAMRDLRIHVDDRLDKLDGSIGRLGFVAKDVYISDQRAVRDFARETRDIATAARTVSIWTLGLMVTITLGAVLTLLVRLLSA